MSCKDIRVIGARQSCTSTPAQSFKTPNALTASMPRLLFNKCMDICNGIMFRYCTDYLESRAAHRESLGMAAQQSARQIRSVLFDALRDTHVQENLEIPRVIA
ncbi:hypothetical protein [Verminephrobacter aporrectodeae]|uniref:hypothetical protein n=1 Tax=Verminephrobacter aporrectodeae TaxID=1110389 RepID=UPI00111033E7|nr:hypothetical protein [Verminephrobacter aporrectodeae]